MSARKPLIGSEEEKVIEDISVQIFPVDQLIEAGKLSTDQIKDDYGDAILRSFIGGFCAGTGLKVRIYAVPANAVQGDIGFDVEATPEKETELYQNFLSKNDEFSAKVLAQFVLRSNTAREILLKNNPKIRNAFKEAFARNKHKLPKDYQDLAAELKWDFEQDAVHNFYLLSDLGGRVAEDILLEVFSDKSLQSSAKDLIQKHEADGGPTLEDSMKQFIPSFQLNEYIKNTVGTTNETQSTLKPVPMKIFERLGFLGGSEWTRSSVRGDDVGHNNVQIASSLMTMQEAKDLTLCGLQQLENLSELLTRKEPIDPHKPSEQKIQENSEAYQISGVGAGCDLYLMKLPDEEKELRSDRTHLYLYKGKSPDERIYYYINDNQNKQYLDEVKFPADLVFNSSSDKPIKYENHKVIEDVLAITSTRDHTLGMKAHLLWDRVSERTGETKASTNLPPVKVGRALSNTKNMAHMVRSFVKEHKEFKDQERDLMTERFRPFLSKFTWKEYLKKNFNNNFVQTAKIARYNNQAVIKANIMRVKTKKATKPPLINVLIDRSGSMKGSYGGKTKTELVIEALKQQFQRYKELGADVGFKIAWFDSASGWLTPKEIRTSDTSYEKFAEMLDKAGQQSGALYPNSGTALLEGYKTLLGGIEPGRKVQNFIVTDGFPNADGVPLPMYHKKAEEIYNEKIRDRVFPDGSKINPEDVSAVGLFIESGFDEARAPIEACIAPFSNANKKAQNVVLPVRPDLLRDQIASLSIVDNSEKLEVYARVPGGEPILLGHVTANNPESCYIAIPPEYLKLGKDIYISLSDGTTLQVNIPKDIKIEDMSPKEKAEYELHLIKREVELRAPGIFATTESIIAPQNQKIFMQTADELAHVFPDGAALFKSQYILPKENPSKQVLIHTGLLEEPQEGRTRMKYRFAGDASKGRKKAASVASTIGLDDMPAEEIMRIQINKFVTKAISNFKAKKSKKAEEKKGDVVGATEVQQSLFYSKDKESKQAIAADVLPAAPGGPRGLIEMKVVDAVKEARSSEAGEAKAASGLQEFAADMLSGFHAHYNFKLTEENNKYKAIEIDEMKKLKSDEEKEMKELKEKWDNLTKKYNTPYGTCGTQDKGSGFNEVAREFIISRPGLLKRLVEITSYKTTVEAWGDMFIGSVSSWQGPKIIEALKQMNDHKGAELYQQISDEWSFLYSLSDHQNKIKNKYIKLTDETETKMARQAAVIAQLEHDMKDINDTVNKVVRTGEIRSYERARIDYCIERNFNSGDLPKQMSDFVARPDIDRIPPESNILLISPEAQKKAERRSSAAMFEHGNTTHTAADLAAEQKRKTWDV